jgi:hypothetical protein
MLQAISDFLYIEWLADLVIAWSWLWPIAEMLHFIGLALLVGVTGLFDLRLLGVAKSIPPAAIHELMPWALAGFGLCLVTGVLFVSGNAFKEPIVLLTNLPFQLKMLLMLIAGVNAAVFYLRPIHEAVAGLGPGDKAPVSARVIAGTSLAIWVGVIYFGRLIPWEDAILYALGM